MNVKDVMAGTPAFCTPETNAGTAAEIMWNRNCGLLPIVDREGKVMGVVTDRDMCIALATRNVRAGELMLRVITTNKVHSCYPEDEIHNALKIMTQHKVRRLVVVDRESRLQGIVSIDDLVRHATDRSFGRFPELSYGDVFAALRTMVGPKASRVVGAKVAV